MATVRPVLLALALLAGWIAIAAAGEKEYAAESKSLCNARYRQARDNFFARLDVRDGQVRIGAGEASFRVYLLNTMNRALFDLKLEVVSDEFTGRAEPSPAWRDYPILETTRRDGKEQYFTVTLKRKPGVPDGEYKIGLRLMSSKLRRADKPLEFLNLKLDALQAVNEVPLAGRIRIDGHAEEQEWQQGFVCTDLHYHLPTDHKDARVFFPFQKNTPAKEITRFRLLADAANIYCLARFAGGEGATRDSASIYLASGAESKPVRLDLDRLTGEATCTEKVEGLTFRADAEKKLFEMSLPRKALGELGSPFFRANFRRSVTGADGKEDVSYWHGNSMSIDIPASYPTFHVAEKAK